MHMIFHVHTHMYICMNMTPNSKPKIRLGDMRGRAPMTTMLSLAFTPHDTLCGAEDGSIFLFSHDG